MADDWERRFDRRFEELKDLWMELAAQRGLSIAPRTGPTQSSEGNSGGGPDDRTLLVKIHSMEYRISCEVLKSVFSRFGILEDIEILSPETGFHSRICFKHRESAMDAFNSFNGRNIYDGCCEMELVFMSTLDSSSFDYGKQQMGSKEFSGTIVKVVDPSRALKVFDGIPSSQVQDRTLLVKIRLMQYSISCLELDKVFSRIGNLEEIEILSPESEFHSKVCFKNKESAMDAFSSLNGRDIYDGCCRMELFLMSNLGNEQSISNEIESSYEASRNESFLEGDEMFNREEESTLIEMENDPTVGKEPATLVARQVFDEMSDSQIYHEQELSFEMGTVSQVELNLKVPTTMINHEQDNLEVIPDVAKVSASDVVAYRNLSELVEDPIDCIKVGLDNFKVNSFEFLTNSSAHNLYDEMSNKDSSISVLSDHQERMLMGQDNRVFDPGDFINLRFKTRAGLEHQKFSKSKLMPSCEYNPWILDPKVGVVISIFDPGIISYDWICKLLSEFDPSDGSMLCVHNGSMKTLATSIFDPGIAYRTEVASSFLVQKFGGIIFDLCAGIILVFDPGGGLSYYISKGVLNFWSRRFESACVQPKTVSYMEDLVQLSSGIPNEFIEVKSFPFDPGGVDYRC